jgi:hypothetical protein
MPELQYPYAFEGERGVVMVVAGIAWGMDLVDATACPCHQREGTLRAGPASGEGQKERRHDSTTGTYAEHRIGRNELAFFPKGTHHVTTEASDVNRLCVLMIPGFLGEVPSDRL